MDEFTHANIYLFPFEKIPKDSKVVVWGKGHVGAQFYKELIEVEYASTVHWTDTNSVQDDSNFIDNNKDAYYVIAIFSDKIRKSVAEKLVQLGVLKSHIVCDKPHSIIYKPTWFVIDTKIELSTLNERIIEEIRYFYESLKIKNVVGHDFIRVGAANDGGYVMLDDLSGGVAYSFGINDDVSWDDDMTNHGYEVFMYDHTIDELPYTKEAFNFFKEGIAEIEETDNLKKLETFIKRNKHGKNENMILKIDVEGAEWGVFENISDDILKLFNQMVVEFHNLCELNNIARYNKVLEKINRTHQPIHYHINNYDDVYWFADKPYGNAIEVTFANREKYKFIDKEIKLPRSQDAPNCKDIDDIVIGTLNKEGYYE